MKEQFIRGIDNHSMPKRKLSFKKKNDWYLVTKDHTKLKKDD